jgi:hypothetical protein
MPGKPRATVEIGKWPRITRIARILIVFIRVIRVSRG